MSSFTGVASVESLSRAIATLKEAEADSFVIKLLEEEIERTIGNNRDLREQHGDSTQIQL